MPTFVLAGQPYTRPVFETYNPQQKYFDQMAAAGCEVMSFSAPFGRYATSQPMWTAAGESEFREFDDRAARILTAGPNTWIMPRIYLGTPTWWLEEHPQDLQVLHDGTTVYPPSVQTPVPKDQPFASIASPRWQSDMAESLVRLIEHVEATPYASRMFGYMVTGLFTEEWYHWSSGADLLADYSSHMVRAFRSWLRRKYGHDQQLQLAWHDPNIDLASVRIPSQKERVGDNQAAFRDPQREMPVIDYYSLLQRHRPRHGRHPLRAPNRDAGDGRSSGRFTATCTSSAAIQSSATTPWCGCSSHRISTS